MSKNERSDSLLRIEVLRFKNDSPANAGVCSDPAGMEEYQEELRRKNLASSTRIVPEIFPEIGKAVEDVRKKVIPDYEVDAFVRNSAEFQACCFPGSGKSISIALTSGLIQLSTMDELRFVIGHELGHHLLGHYAYPRPDNSTNQVEKLNLLALSRAAEISADRIGFLAVSKKEHAYKAVLKIATGLPDKLLRFDLSAYLKQARDLRKLGGSECGLLSSHPVCTTRMRALLWFEMSKPYQEWCGKKGSASLSANMLDKKVAKDMASVSGFRLADINKKEADSAMRWGVLSLFVSDGHLSKEEQVLLKQTFGDEVAEGLLSFLRAHGPDGVVSKFEAALRSIRLMSCEIKEALYLDLERFAKFAGGEIIVREQVLRKTLSSIALDREIDFH